MRSVSVPDLSPNDDDASTNPPSVLAIRVTAANAFSKSPLASWIEIDPSRMIFERSSPGLAAACAAGPDCGPAVGTTVDADAPAPPDRPRSGTEPVSLADCEPVCGHAMSPATTRTEIDAAKIGGHVRRRAGREGGASTPSRAAAARK